MSLKMKGPIVITTTQTVDLSKWGIQIGDPINVICVGGGGGGGGNKNTSNYIGGAAGSPGENIGRPAGSGYGCGGGGCQGGGNYGGGGGSGYVKQLSMIVDTLSVAVTIGAAGVGGNAATGGTGGTTKFGSYLSASGGTGGTTMSTSNETNGNNGAGGNTSTTIGYGANGVVPNGYFSIQSGEGSGLAIGTGCVMIWY